uniref:ATP synthase F0 subunit 8 n=1 Tax=Odontoglaja guamensis TaxID=259595 RepID=E6Y1B3_9GAST|nr:ATP synthase F0 subunit 8 [Odontoglaja guamensis]
MPQLSPALGLLMFMSCFFYLGFVIVLISTINLTSIMPFSYTKPKRQLKVL